MRGTGMEKEVGICAANITNKTKCMSTNAVKLGKIPYECCSMIYHVSALKKKQRKTSCQTEPETKLETELLPCLLDNVLTQI
jgi:hypothetical protein